MYTLVFPTISVTPSKENPTQNIFTNTNGVFTLPDTDTDAETDTDAIGFETHCVGVGTSVGKGKICVGVGQCEHTIRLM